MVIQLWYVMPTLFELAGTRSSSDCPLERKMRKRQVFSKESWLSTVTDCYSFNSQQITQITHCSHRTAVSVNLLRSIPWVCECALPRPFAEPTLPSLLTVKAAHLRRESLSCEIGTFDEHLDFVTTSLKCQKTQKSRDSINFPNCTRLQWFTSTMSCWQFAASKLRSPHVSTVSTGVLSVLCANGFATIWDSAAVWIRSRIFEASANEFTTMLRSFLISSPIFALQQNWTQRTSERL